MLSIDGSRGEGGGQILRTSIALSIVTGQPIEIYNIRAKRPNPGLRPQHLWALKAASELSNARVDGLGEGSTRVVFHPGELKTSALKIDIGTAGSITLLLQGLIPALVLSKGTFSLNLRGGTDVKWSPTLDYFRRIVIPIYSLMGIDVEMHVTRRGFYPVGGGEVSCAIRPTGAVNAMKLESKIRGDIGIASICSNLPKSVAERQLRSAEEFLAKNGVHVKTRESSVEPAISPGSAICIYQTIRSISYIGGDSIGERGKPSERVGMQAAELFLSEYLTGCVLDSHIADMVVHLLALSKQESVFITSRQTEHLSTNLHVSDMIVGSKHSVETLENGTVRVRIFPKYL
jgi:RNA 3'-terminal phosphate cyclase (ATP)